ncbi:MAG: 50S ribosomal protein L11, partial [Candidatus Phytoplasma australasiaticum]|nr:50S ribosomal protein L11 [Candidatus Phytoplasma australasiaticum]
SQFNEATKDKLGFTLPVEITVFDDKSFKFIVKT